MNLVFVTSSWLWLLLLVPLFWFAPHRAANWRHAAIRSAVVILLIVALARPALLTEQSDSYQVLVWDRSESISAPTAPAVDAWLERLPDSARARVITLGGRRDAAPDMDGITPLQIDDSSIGRGLATAARLIPEGASGAVTVLSDGMATDPHWGDAVRQLVEREIPVHTIAVARRSDEVYPAAIRTSPPLRVGQTTQVAIDVIGTAGEVVVSLLADGSLLARSTPFASRERSTVVLEFEPTRPGLLEVTAEVQVVTGSDPNPDNNRFDSTLAVQEPIKALYLSERLTNSRDKMNTLTGPGVELAEPSDAQVQALAKSPEGIAAYDLIVIDDRPAESIPLPVQEAIVQAVRNDGVGLFYAGGKGVFGTGGYFDTPVASILPVEMIQKEEKRDPSTTLVVIIDTSGSMSGERVQLAKECARLAIRRLLPHDKVGIVEFYGTKQWAAPIQSAANAIDIQRAINRMDAGGGTVILPAIEEAFYAMQNVQTRYKHVLVLTDGGVESGDFESLMRRMAAKGINVSTVLVGSDAHSEFLVNIANWGKGHFYSASSRFNIPEVLLKQPSTSKIPPYRPGEHLVSMGGPSGWWGDIPRPKKAQLAGYVETRLRPGAQVAIETETERHPVLASWRYGLGRVSAFTTEPVGEGTAPWREWDGYGAWLMRTLSRTSREHPQPFAYTIERSPTGARVVARRLIPQPYLPAAERIDGDGNAEALTFQQRSPDVFTAKLLEEPEANIHLRAGAAGWPGRKAHLVSPAWQAVAPEHNVDPQRAVDLAALASATGGQSVALDTVSQLRPSPGGTGSATDLHRLWPWCLVLALLSYLGDILYRRWPGTPASGTGKTAAAAVIVTLAFLSAPPLKAEIAPALEAKLQETLKQDTFQVDDGALYAAALLEDESLEPLLKRLDAIITEDEQAFDAIWLSASLKWRYGLLDDALELFQKAAELRAEPLPLFRLAQLLDAKGKTADAATQYLKALEAKPDDALTGRIQLRLALLKSTEDNIENVDEDLPAFARKQDQTFQNRAGVVLALTGKPKDALALYKPGEEADQAFKQLVRIAEWSIAAKDFPKAQESAWGALRSAKLKRDRRYALTVLAEAYRSDKKLDALVARFAATPDLSAEARMTWIDLLREQGDVDQALALFQDTKAKADGAETFTADMRRQMLEICREAGRDDLLVANYREMITKEPRRLEWRAGLCRFHLERGERDKGIAVWKDFKDQAKRGDWLAAAGAAMELGLDELAKTFAEELVAAGEGTERLAALQFLFDLHKTRSREDAMKTILTRMDELAAPDASERARIAESWEQLGRQDKAVEVLEKLREARKAEDFSSDLETRLAWLYSETGAEEKAFEAWKRVWLRIDSPGRRRYVEDRFMATASRLGKIADIAIELEEKLADGKADKRDSALLVRLYTKVGDPVSASEIIHDFMKQSGGSEIKMLEEQARVYVMCNDYYHYEKTLRKLMQLDPEGTPEYFTQLAMSALERGRNDEARAILTEMRNLAQNPASAEFEAGVLKIAGMHQEANAAYWRGIAQHPDRIDSYLLLGRSLQTLGKAPQATGLFQYLVETADKDDLFTIAIDGLLNMNNPRQGSQLSQETLRWARRAILERLAARDDKVYLFQLLSDVSEDLRDRDMMIRTLAETLPIAGERRTAQLRELMELAKANSRESKDGMMRFGRRLVGMGEIIPPQVYLDLGAVFLDSGDVRNALKTFDNAGGGLDEAGYQRKVADAFEKKRYARSALRSYEQLLITAPDDVGVLVKVGELKEQLDRDAEAAIAYRRALDLLMDGQPLFSFKGRKTGGSRTYYYSRNVDRFDKYYLRVLTGFLATSDPGGTACAGLVDDAMNALKSDLTRLERERAVLESGDTLGLENVPRVARRSQMIRRLCLAGGQLEKGGNHEQLMLTAFPTDSTLLPEICRDWKEWGYAKPARGWAEALPDQDLRQRALDLLDTKNTGGELFQLVLKGKDDDARARLRDIERLIKESGSSTSFNFLFTMARYLDDPAAIERLTRHAISRAPKSQRLVQSISMLSRAFPSLNQAQRDRLIAHVEGLIADQDAGTTRSAYYYYPRLKQLTGRNFKLPAESIRPEIEKMLARGGHYNRYVASMFSFLEEDEYRNLLTDAYRKSKASDRLTLVFGLVRQYPGTMTPGMQATFLELAGDAAEGNTQDPLRIYQRSAPNPHYGGKPNNANAGFEALLLEKFAEGTPKDQRLDFLIEQIRAWHRADDRGQAFAAIATALDLAMKDDKAFAKILSLQSGLPADYLDGFLTALDERSAANGPEVADEQKRLRIVRAARDPERLFAALHESIRRFPTEVGFRQELRKELEQQGRLFEAAAVQEGLAKLDPDNEEHRTELQGIWMRLAHPIKAGTAQKPAEDPEAKEAAPPDTTVSVTKSPNPPPPGKPTPPAKTTKTETPARTSAPKQEKPLETASAQLLKKHYEAGKPDEARRTLRRLWRQFPNLDRYRGQMYRMPTSSRYYAWPSDKKAPPRKPSNRISNPGKDGLKAYLAAEVPALPQASRTSQPSGETIFSAIGAEEFVAAELQTWLQTFEPRNFQASLFEDIIGAVTRQQVEAQGAEAFITKSIEAFRTGTSSALDQHALLTALELHPEAGGQAASEFLDLQRSGLAPGDLWKTMRLARCFAKRGNEDAAITLYRWCGANAGYTSYISPSRTNVTANYLLDEVRRTLEGPSRRKALEAILPLLHVDNPHSSSQSTFAQFVLTHWAEEVPAHEIYRHCPDLCRGLVHGDQPAPRGGTTALELATLFLAAGGQTEDALQGLQRLLAPKANSTPDRYGRTSSNRPPGCENHLQRLFPEDMSAWKNAGPWLSGTAERVRTWHAAEVLPTTDAIKTLSVVAVRQHQNGFAADAQATLATARTLPLNNPKVATWLLDAAGLTGNADLAIEVASTLLTDRRLPIDRIAALMEGIAARQGAPAALTLAEATLDYTWEPTFLQTMATIATQAGNEESARLWTNRHQQVAPAQKEEENSTNE